MMTLLAVVLWLAAIGAAVYSYRTLRAERLAKTRRETETHNAWLATVVDAIKAAATENFEVTRDSWDQVIISRRRASNGVVVGFAMVELNFVTPVPTFRAEVEGKKHDWAPVTELGATIARIVRHMKNFPPPKPAAGQGSVKIRLGRAAVAQEVVNLTPRA